LHRFRDQDPSGRRELLDPVRDVDRVADRGEVHAPLRADVAHDHGARVDADADLHGPDAVPVGRAPLGHAALDVDGRRDRLLRVVRQRCRRAEVRHHRVAHELVDGAAARDDRLRGELEDLVEQPDHVLRLHSLGESGKAPNIDEQNRHVALGAGERDVARRLE
jgi:hypothetical protein